MPEDWPKTVVLLEQQITDQKGKKIIAPMGTAFIIDFEKFNVLVTARHLVFNRSNLFASYNQKGGSIGRRSLEEIQKVYQVGWIYHPNSDVDIALTIFAINPTTDDIKKIPQDLFEDCDVLSEGQEIFFLGFPMGLKGGQFIRPMVRAGIIAQRQDDNRFLIDGNVFPGNSGSPVFLKPSIFDFKTKTLGKITQAKLVGMISESISYVDTAYSQQTKRARVTFEENSALGVVFANTYIKEILSSKEMKDVIERIKKTRSAPEKLNTKTERDSD